MTGGWSGSARRDALPKDWSARRARVLRRDGYRCTEVMRGERCSQVATDVDHVVPHYLGGTDDLDNLTSLCTGHHAAKSSGEGNAAKAARVAAAKRPRPMHPGRLSG